MRAMSLIVCSRDSASSMSWAEAVMGFHFMPLVRTAGRRLRRCEVSHVACSTFAWSVVMSPSTSSTDEGVAPSEYH